VYEPDTEEAQMTDDSMTQSGRDESTESSDAVQAGFVPENETPAADIADAWDDVLARVGELGDSISRWAKAASDDPENRRRWEEVRVGMDEMARKAEEAFNEAADSEQGARMRRTAEDAGKVVGDGAQRVADAAAPTVAVVFASLAEAFGQAATAVGESAAPAPRGDAADDAAASEKTAEEPPEETAELDADAD
jgi:hypothetical protein